MAAKFKIQEMKNISKINCLMSVLISSPLHITKIPITIHRKKKTSNPISQKVILAYFEKKSKIGELGATILLKKKRTPKMIKKNPMLFLLILSIFFVECFFLATFLFLRNKISFFRL